MQVKLGPGQYYDKDPKKHLPVKTQMGRVVYNRPVHFFSYADVQRILRKIQPPKAVKPGFFDFIREMLRNLGIKIAKEIVPILPVEMIGEGFDLGVLSLDILMSIGDVPAKRKRVASLIESLKDRFGID